MEPKTTDTSAVFSTGTSISDGPSWLTSLSSQIRESLEEWRHPHTRFETTSQDDPEALERLLESRSALGSLAATMRGIAEDRRRPHTYEISADAADVAEIWESGRHGIKVAAMVGYVAVLGLAIAGLYAVNRIGHPNSTETTVAILSAMTEPMPLKVEPPPPPPPPDKPQPVQPPPKVETVTAKATNEPEPTPGPVTQRPDLKPEPIPLPKKNNGGGGGGGMQAKTPASFGEPPPFVEHPLAPPMVNPIINPNASLIVQPALGATNPIATIRTTSNFGNPLAPPSLPPSPGFGKGGGIGDTGNGGGVGDGQGNGLGRGKNGGTGGGEDGGIRGRPPGGGGGIGPGGSGPGGTGPNTGSSASRGSVTNPVALYTTKPNYSEDGRKNRIQGTVMLEITILADGTVDPANVKVMRKLGFGLDEMAIKEVKTWKFKPATENGTPVAKTAYIEVNFKLL